eukprot:scaffold12957_cov92-Isochrysis_galbana.AAC.4
MQYLIGSQLLAYLQGEGIETPGQLGPGASRTRWWGDPRWTSHRVEDLQRDTVGGPKLWVPLGMEVGGCLMPEMGRTFVVALPSPSLRVEHKRCYRRDGVCLIASGSDVTPGLTHPEQLGSALARRI